MLDAGCGMQGAASKIESSCPNPGSRLLIDESRCMRMRVNNPKRKAFSLWELMAVAFVLGIVALFVVPRLSGSQDTAKKSGCYANKADIELQAKLWRRNNGSY